MNNPRTLNDLYVNEPEDHRDLVRVAAALGGFRQQFGHWPSRLRLNAGHLAGLHDLLTREAFSELASKVKLAPEDDLFDVIGEDHHGNSWPYGNNPIPRSTNDAVRWIWGIEP